MFLSHAPRLTTTLIGSMILGCAFAAAAEAQEPDAAVAQHLTELADPNRAKRDEATRQLLSWASENADAAIPLFLKNMEKAVEPEQRERSIKILRALATIDYDTIGEGYLGIQMGDELAVKIFGHAKPCYGLVVTGVTDGSPAKRAGILAGDIIVSFNGEFFHEPGQLGMPRYLLSEKIRLTGAGKKAVFGVFNNGILLQREAKLSRRPTNLENIVENRLLFNGAQLNLGALAQQQIEEEKQSDEFFQEWLNQQWEKYPAK